MPSTMSEKEAAGQLLDNLYLEMFHLIEENVQSRVNLERAMASGSILLARGRFQLGDSGSVSTVQIPTEDSAQFKALCRVVDAGDGSGIRVERQAVDKSKGYVEPLHWFSALPPLSLRNAASKFKACIELVVEGANLQRQLANVIEWIAKLRQNPLLN